MGLAAPSALGLLSENAASLRNGSRWLSRWTTIWMEGAPAKTGAEWKIKALARRRPHEKSDSSSWERWHSSGLHARRDTLIQSKKLDAVQPAANPLQGWGERDWSKSRWTAPLVSSVTLLWHFRSTVMFFRAKLFGFKFNKSSHSWGLECRELKIIISLWKQEMFIGQVQDNPVNMRKTKNYKNIHHFHSHITHNFITTFITYVLFNRYEEIRFPYCRWYVCWFLMCVMQALTLPVLWFLKGMLMFLKDKTKHWLMWNIPRGEWTLPHCSWQVGRCVGGWGG